MLRPPFILLYILEWKKARVPRDEEKVDLG
jgi:hypothetical protein